METVEEEEEADDVDLDLVYTVSCIATRASL
jgi:hypothetical protein